MNAVFWHLATQCLAEIRRQEEEEYSMTGNGMHPVTISELEMIEYLSVIYNRTNDLFIVSNVYYFQVLLDHLLFTIDIVIMVQSYYSQES